MYTSYFANLKKLPKGTRPIGIAVGPPAWYKGESYPALAPTRAMLKMSADDYDAAYDAILAELDPATVYAELGAGFAVLLCWEKPGERCHRRKVAEWLENALGVVIPEYGMKRADVLPYATTPRKTKGGPKKRKPVPLRPEGFLF